MSATEAATVVGVEAVDTGTGEIHRPTVLMTEDEARIITADIKAWAGTLWQKLKQAYDGQAWRALGYGSWRDYIDTEFDMGKSQAYRLLTHANAVYEIAEAAGLDPDELSPAGDTLTERVTRDLDVEAVVEAVRAAMASIEPGAKATRQEITERIVKAMRAQNPKPAKAAPPDVPSDAEREAAAFAAGEARANDDAPPADEPNDNDQASDAGGATPAASDGPEQDPAPAAAQDPGKAGAPESRAAATGSTGASSAGAGDGGGTGDVLPTPPAETLPADWRDLIGHAAYIVRLDPALVAAAATDDDRADLQALTDWLSLVDEASDPAVLAEPQEQTA